MVKKFLMIAAFALPLIPLFIIFAAGALPADDTQARAERLAPTTINQLARLPLGSEVLLEGTISDRSVPKFRTFVAYKFERHYLNTDLSDMWQLENVQTEPFVLQLAGGLVSIGGAGYQILNPATTEQQPGNVGSNPVRYSGFQIGDRVVLLGRLTGQDTVTADVVIGGTRAAYLAARQATATWSALFIGLSTALVALAFIALYFGRSHTRRISPTAVR